MKPNIHPETMESIITCVCGATYKTISTKRQVRVEICSKCHPFYTGEQAKIIDTAGRVESFRRRYGLTEKARD
jgi:large subunit ribosomal protein L31